MQKEAISPRFNFFLIFFAKKGKKGGEKFLQRLTQIFASLCFLLFFSLPELENFFFGKNGGAAKFD